MADLSGITGSVTYAEPCFICSQPGDTKPRKFAPILPGNPAHFGEPEPILHPAHADCYQRWYKDIYRELAELDRSLNECAYFERTPGTKFDGFYVKDGVRLPCKSWYRGDEMEHLYPELKGTAWWRARWEAA